MKTSEAIAVRPGARQQSSSATVIRLAESAIRDAHRNGVLSIILAIPFELGSDEARLLLQSSSVSGLVLPFTSATIFGTPTRGPSALSEKTGYGGCPRAPMSSTSSARTAD